ncbi:hypothetical protein C8R41DRAFT_919836 [Lentinula lateritia]|uniref:SUN domain-containing protein n=1 Tax=Lentinula lateritia TaxID=40482 RepID=A0ABQ8V390_9AGAR|nr:hypothetical protein C8R41DRAFT_925108 [Lentinula lateritia]KAJ4492524.1 hypothetical protein C8R41DRAFT_919836 [Lentinula lateritia]
MNAKRFVLKDSSIPNVYKIKTRSYQEQFHTCPTVEEQDQNTPAKDRVLSGFLSLITTTFRKLFQVLKVVGNLATLAASILAIISFVIGVLAPVQLPLRLSRLLCSAMSLLCLIQRVVPTEAQISCDAGYFHSLWNGPVEVNPIPSTVPTTLVLQPETGFLPLDFALASNGAGVIVELTSDTDGMKPRSLLHKWASIMRGYDNAQMAVNPPIVVLEEPLYMSECWAFAGSRGHIAVSLPSTILVHNFTVHFPDHHGIVKEKLRQAPKDIALWALVPKTSMEHNTNQQFTEWERFVMSRRHINHSLCNSSSAFLQIAHLTIYDFSAGMHQIFQTLSPVQTSVVLIEILDNWGGGSTCLHRVSIHGISDL